MEPVSAIIVGVFMLSFSVSKFVEYVIDIYRFITIRTKGVRGKGFVKDLIYDEEERLACRLFVEYKAIDGKTYEVKSSTGNAFWSKYKGKYIDIIYNRNDPKTVFIKKEMKLQFGLLFIFYLLWSSVGFYFLFYGLYNLIFS